MIDRRHAVAAALALVVWSTAPPERAGAQETQRGGFWVELGLGPSVALVSCKGCDDPTTDGAGSGYLRLGGTVASDVRLGLEIATHSTDVFTPVEPGEAGKVEISNLTAVVLWAPWSSGLLVKGGVGAVDGRVTVEPEGVVPVTARETGVGLTFGAGWELAIHRRIAVALHGATWISALGDVVLASRQVEDIIATTYGLTLGLKLR